MSDNDLFPYAEEVENEAPAKVPVTETEPKPVTEAAAAPDFTREAKRAALFTGFGVLLIAAVSNTLAVILSSAYSALSLAYPELFEASDAIDTLATWIISFLPMYAVGFPMSLVFFKKLPTFRLPGQKLGTGNFFLSLLICFPMMYIGSLAGTLLSSLLSFGNSSNMLESLVLDNNAGWVTNMVLVVLAPIMEELFFRKIIIDRTAVYGEKAAVIFSAVLFAAFHMNLYQIFYAFLLGLLFGYVYMRTRRIQYSILLHMVVNFFGSVVSTAVLSLVDLDAVTNFLNAGDFDGLASVLPGLLAYAGYSTLYMGLVVAGIVLFFVKARKSVKFLPAERQIPDKKAFKTFYLNVGVILFLLLCLAGTILVLVSYSA